jgi:hypothetical protein
LRLSVEIGKKRVEAKLVIMTDIKVLIQKLDALADELLTAPHFRARVHMAEHVYDALGDITQSVEETVKTTADKAVEVSDDPEIPTDHMDEQKPVRPLRFRKLTLVQAARIVLKEHGQLHGTEIDRLVKEGGYKSKAEHFQSTLAVAFRRDGGFENVGENTWRLKLPSTEPRISEALPMSLNGSAHE